MKQLKANRLSDPNWGVAGQIPAAELAAIAPSAPADWNVLANDAGFSVLLVVGPFDADSAAERLARKHRNSAYSLDFDDEALSVHEYLVHQERCACRGASSRLLREPRDCRTRV